MIEFHNVSKTYANGTRALHDVNLKIEDREFAFIVGASGAGKSTLLKLIMREELPTSGKVIVGSYNISRLHHRSIPYLRRTMGIVFQDFRLIPNKNVYENVAFALRVTGASGKKIRKEVPKALRLVGLSKKAKNKPDELSGGEQQRVALARALVNNPVLIIADEPTGNIDPNLSMELMELLIEINKRGTTVLVVTHEKELVNRFMQRVIVLEDGRVAEDRVGGYVV